jgi:hypothetical protein
MTAILWSWAVSAVVLLALAAVLGRYVVGDRPKVRVLGILIDNRGRFSLNHAQVVAWSVVIVSLVSGVFFGRLIDGVASPLEFTIPERVFGLLGISLGAGVASGAVKANKSKEAAAKPVSEPPPAGRASTRLATYQATGRAPFPAQMFMVEEGEHADDAIDITKFQSFGITVVLVVAYVAMAIHSIVHAKTAGHVTSLPDIKGTFLVLLGIGYTGYTGGKLLTPAGTPRTA